MRSASAWDSPTTTATEPRAARSPLSRLRQGLSTPVDAAALAAFRVVWGALLLIAVVRFAAKGMIHQAFVEPRLFFPLVPSIGPLPPPGMHVLYAVLALSAVLLTIGLYTRLAAAVFALLFSYAHFADLTNYLNHYYLVTLMTALLAVLPVSRLWAVDAVRGARREQAVPAWTLWLPRFQIGCVYVFAGVAKLESDWIVRGLPLRIWLPGSGDVPVLGPLFGRLEAALVMSWAGAAFDLAIPFLLLWRRSRAFAYVAVVVFHLLTARLFRLGMFPFFMMAASLLFLESSWARRLARASDIAPSGPTRPVPRTVLLALAAYAVCQIGLPLRHHLSAGNVLWTEHGFRFSWRVMLMEKTGVAELTLRDLASGKERPVRVRDYLTPLQTKMMSTQPDLIRSFARALGREAEAAGRRVAVFADVLVSLNGRPARRLVDPGVDLAADSLPAGWILPFGGEPPPLRHPADEGVSRR